MQLMSELLDITHARCWRAADDYFVVVPYAINVSTTIYHSFTLTVVRQRLFFAVLQYANNVSTTRYRSFTLSVVRQVLIFIRSLTIRNLCRNC